MQLRSWQQNFVNLYRSSEAQKSLLIATVGTGRTITALSAAKAKIEKGDISGVIVVSDRKDLQHQWMHVAREIGIDIDTAFGQKNSSVTYQSVVRNNSEFDRVVSKQDSIFIFDDSHRSGKTAEKLGKEILRQNPSCKLLYLSSIPISGNMFDWTHEIGREFIYQPEIVRDPETQIEIAKYSPSILLLEQLRAPGFSLEGLSWRQFEILISKLLESDGYEIELMSGTKDDGVDIVAVKDMKEAGLYKALWQAKKYKKSNKVGISTIRELADVRSQFGASKGIIVTTSYLTRGALDRVYRDKFVLGKVDRNDLDSWINRKLLE